MYAEAGLQLPLFSQGFLQEVAGGGYESPYSHFSLSGDESLLNFDVGIADGGLNLGNMVQTPTVAEYDMGGEGDLFKAAEAILEEPALELHIAAAMSILSTEGDVITEPIKVADMESIQNDHLNSVIYECKKDLLEESEIQDSITELLGINIPTIQIDEIPSLEKLGSMDGSIQKSTSSGSLNSVELIRSSTMRPDQFFDLQGLDLADAYSLRRAYSEGDIQNLGNKSISTGNTVAVCSSFEQLLTISDLKTERQQKLSRYREKKSKRNFGRKIKYACRKALADSQPRVRGRFAKTEECESLKPNMRIHVLHSLDSGRKFSVHSNCRR